MTAYHVENISLLLCDTFTKEQLVAHAAGMTFWLDDPEILHDDKQSLAVAMVRHAANRANAYPFSLVDELLHWARMNATSLIYEQYEPYYPNRRPQSRQPLHLVRLCLRLATEVSAYELRAICHWLRVNPERFGFNAHPTNMAAIISLVNHFDKRGQMDAFLLACESLRPGIREGLELAG